MKLVLDDGEKVPVHRAIIASRNEYFGAMLIRDFAESHLPEIPVHGLTKPFLILLLQHLYSDAVDIPADDLVPMFLLADKFNIEPVRQQALEEFVYCTWGILEFGFILCWSDGLLGIDEDNAALLLRAVWDVHEDLKKQVLLYIKHNYDKTAASPDWKELPPEMKQAVEASRANPALAHSIATPPAAAAATPEGGDLGPTLHPGDDLPPAPRQESKCSVS